MEEERRSGGLIDKWFFIRIGLFILIFPLIFWIIDSIFPDEIGWFNDDRCCTCACFHHNESTFDARPIEKLKNSDCVCEWHNTTFIT